MDYEEAMSFLEDTKKYGSRLGLGTIRALMRELGDVQEKVPVIHIGGTNGKGSVGAMLSSVLTEAGYRVGWFNSPDVFSFEEEFMICGEPIGKTRLAQIFTEVREACVRLTGQKTQPYPADSGTEPGLKGFPHPTRFEVETAAAFLWFCEEQCDIAVIEVGMGGATDATNVVERPLISVLTSIGKDHMHTLGATLPEIARVKAGIIKPGCPVVTVKQEPSVMRVILERCGEVHAPLYRADAGLAGDLSYLDGVSSFNWDGTRITLGLYGPLQAENASCALKVLEVLRERGPGSGPDISDAAVVRGMKNVRWPGRYEQIRPCTQPGPSKRPGPDGPALRTGPVILLDGAHNEDAARRLREALDADFSDRRIFYIMGVLADKDYETMAGIMFRPGDRVFTVTAFSQRALPAQDLAAMLRGLGIDAVPCETVRDAVSFCAAEAGADDVITAFGSLYCLREIRAAFCETAEPDADGKDGTV